MHLEILILDFRFRQSSTEDEEKPLVPIDPSDLKYLFGADSTSQYHDGLTDSEAGSTSSESFDGDTNQMRHSTNSERSPELPPWVLNELPAPALPYAEPLLVVIAYWLPPGMPPGAPLWPVLNCENCLWEFYKISSIALRSYW